MTEPPVVLILGAGPAGLTAALELLRQGGYRPIVIEADRQPGGISRTVEHAGNRIDIGGHRFFSKSDWVLRWWQDVLPLEPAQAQNEIEIRYQNRQKAFVPPATSPHADGGRLLLRSRLSRILFNRRFFSYPLTLSWDTLANLGLWRVVKIGFSYLRASIWLREERTLEDFLINRFGRELYLTFFKSYTEKVWGVPCTELSPEWGAQRIKGLSVAKALIHILKKPFLGRSIQDQRKTQTSLIERFLYPAHGPGQMWEAVAARITAQGGEVRYGQRVVGLHTDANRVTRVRIQHAATGATEELSAYYVISSIPIKDLVAGMDPPPPAPVLDLAVNLPYRDFITVGVLLSGMRAMPGNAARTANHMPPDNWIYVQEPDVQVGRIQIFNNWSPAMVRDPRTIWLGLEYFCNEGDALWGLSDDALKRLAVDELVRLGLISASAFLDAVVIRMPKAYPAYHGTHAQFDRIRQYLDGVENLFLVGRNGMHRYNNQDHSMLTAREAVRCIASGSSDKSQIWTINLEHDYHEEKAG